MQKVQLRKISEIMEQYPPVYPEDKRWESTIEYLLHEPSEREIVEELVKELERDGSFREPILAIHDEETEQKYIGDGTHRLVAAYIAGHETILTADCYPTDDGSDNKNYTTLIHSESKFADDDFELMFDYLRSLKINDQVWITCGISFQEQGKQSFYWDYEPEITAEEITQKVETVLQRVFPLTTFTIETIIEEWEDENEEKNVWDELNEEMEKEPTE